MKDLRLTLGPCRRQPIGRGLADIEPKPTHVVTAPVAVHKSADASSDVVVSLQPGSQVAVMKTADGWTLVARDGQKLGYVEDQNLVRLQ